jgi:hypothetical protein
MDRRWRPGIITITTTIITGGKTEFIPFAPSPSG